MGKIIDYKKVGERIRKKRLEKKLTQEQLGANCEISSVYVSHIEIGSAKPSLEILVKICNALDITPDFALFDSLHTSKEYIKDEIASLLKDCSIENMKLITEIIKTILKVQQ